MQRRRVTKREVEGLLENAGFSRANPYYIVQQGKVSALCVARDEDRLALLKEVGGAGVYEAKRAEAAKTLDETAAKRESIKGVLQAIDLAYKSSRVKRRSSSATSGWIGNIGRCSMLP